jgi:hypothetical protein
MRADSVLVEENRSWLKCNRPSNFGGQQLKWLELPRLNFPIPTVCTPRAPRPGFSRSLTVEVWESAGESSSSATIATRILECPLEPIFQSHGNQLAANPS